MICLTRLYRFRTQISSQNDWNQRSKEFLVLKLMPWSYNYLSTLDVYSGQKRWIIGSERIKRRCQRRIAVMASYIFWFSKCFTLQWSLEVLSALGSVHADVEFKEGSDAYHQMWKRQPCLFLARYLLSTSNMLPQRLWSQQKRRTLKPRRTSNGSISWSWYVIHTVPCKHSDNGLTRNICND
jgi:hypothetical protein